MSTVDAGEFPPWIAVEGLIGEGKSTVLQLLPGTVRATHSIDTSLVLPELVDEFKPLLVDFYNEPQHNAYPLQAEVFRLSIQQHRDIAREIAAGDSAVDCLLSERSFLGHKCFAAVQHSLGNFSSNQYIAYEKWCDMWTEMVPYPLTGVVYLRTPISTCMTRIRGRAREGEEKITEHYMRRLQEAHDAQFLPRNLDPAHMYDRVHTITVGTKRNSYTVPVLCIENTGSIGHRPTLEKIAQFIEDCVAVK